MSITLQVERTLTGSVAVGAPVVFDRVVQTAGDIGYNQLTGVITLNAPGRYAVNWWVATQTSASTSGANFALSSSQGDYLQAASPQKTGQVGGNGVIEVVAAPVTVSLINGSNGSFFYPGQVAVKAGLSATQGDEAPVTDNAACLPVDQLANLLSQMITAYAGSTWTVFSSSLASYSGMPLDLYTAPGAGGPGLLRLLDVNDDYEALAISNITAIAPGAGTVFDPSFTFLPPPDPLPQDCVTDLVEAVRTYLPIGTEVDVRLGPAISATGPVYRNEYGVLVLAEEGGGNPAFLATPHILRIFTDTDPTGLQPTAGGRSGKAPTIRLLKA